MSDDIESLIQSSIADHPDRDNSGEIETSDGVEAVADDTTDVPVAVDTPDPAVGDVPVVEPVAEVVSKPLTAGEKILEEAGFKAKKADGRDNWMPHSRLVKIIDNSHRKLAEELTGTPLGEGAVPVDVIKQHVARIPELETTVTSLKSEAQFADSVLQEMATNPEVFLGKLLNTYPQYANYLRMDGEAVPATTPQQPAAPPQAEMPQPDLDMGDGRFTYSPEGYKKLREWDNARIEAAIEAKMEKRYGPIAKRYEADQAIEAEIPKMRQKVNEAEGKWKGFKENKAEIFDALRSDRTLTLHDAYISVITAKHEAASKAQEAKLKETEARVLAQIKAAPTSTSAGGGGKPAIVVDEPETVEDIIRASIRKIKAG